MEMEDNMVLCYTVSIILLVIGVVFYSGKAASYIKGYQDMPGEEKKAVNINPLCKNLSAVFFLAAVIFGIAGYSEWFRLVCFKWAMIGWIVLCCADIVFINKSGRYGKKTVPDPETLPQFPGNSMLKQGGKR
jgi:hypothetical protein